MYADYSAMRMQFFISPYTFLFSPYTFLFSAYIFTIGWYQDCNFCKGGVIQIFGQDNFKKVSFRVIILSVMYVLCMYIPPKFTIQVCNIRCHRLCVCRKIIIIFVTKSQLVTNNHDIITYFIDFRGTQLKMLSKSELQCKN